jgi:subtilisin family serine protease
MRTVPRRSSILLLAAVVAALAAPAAASADPGQIIVKYAAGADAQDRADARADADVVRNEALALPATELVTPTAGTSVAAAVADLEASPDVAYAEPDQPRRAFDRYPDEALVDEQANPLNDQPFANLWALHNTGQAIGDEPGGTAGADIGAPAAWSVTTGSKDITVAIVDSGVDRSHRDLFANLVPGYDFAYDDADPTDYEGHGTHVAGIIGARGNNGTGVTGVAWDASLMPLQALDAEGAGYASDIAGAYTYAASHGARIVNASLGGSSRSQAEYDAIRNAPNVLFVVAAGNDDRNNDTRPTYPCAYDLPNILCVAATDNTDHLASFSNVGRSTVDIAAPGVDIYSTLRCDAYGWMSGTSMATPEVSGAAALVLAAHPTSTVAELRSRLISTADRLPGGDATRINGGNGGRLDVATAVGLGLTSATGATTNAGDVTVGGTTYAAPRSNEPAPPAPACPAAPVRTSTGTGSGTTTPTTPVTPVTTAPATGTTTTVPVARVTTPAADRTAPTVAAALTARGALRSLLAGKLRVTATASERATVAIALRVDARTARKLHLSSRMIATGTGTLTASGARKVTVKASAKARRALRRVRRLKVAVSARATDVAGNGRTHSRSLTLTR